MAKFEWQLTSITSGETTFYESDSGGVYYGALFGVAGLWIRLPSRAPAIEDIILTAAAVGSNDGLYSRRSTCTGGTGGVNNREVVSGLQVAGFEKGGRWIRIDRTTTLPAKMAVGSAKKNLVLFYTAVSEGTTLDL